jgi:hypothetical protein
MISPQIVDFFHYRERENERPLAACAHAALARKGIAKALRKEGRKVYNFLTVLFFEA